MVRGHRLLAQPLGQVTRGALGHATGVDEDQRGAVLAGELGEAVVDGVPGVVGHHRFERDGRDFDGEVARAGVAHVDDGAARLFLLLSGEKVARRVG